MLFNSLEFLLFLPVAFILYWFVLSKSLRWQNLLIVFASYLFYGWWDYRFLALIFFSTVVDYSIGGKLGIENNPFRRKLLLWVSLAVNLGLLGLFKYYNFFVDNFIYAFSSLGIDLEVRTLNIILPVGISFYTFQTLSYTIDVFKKRIEPTKDFIAFMGFVSFFPQLVAGPIERASTLLPQFTTKRKFTYQQGIDGLLLILWGFFKKIVIADNLAPAINEIFANYNTYSGDVLLLGIFLFAFQLYGDFSGYSNIARGLAKWFGFELMVNFNYPILSRNVGEFWRRWHISLFSWFKDYIFMVFGTFRMSKLVVIRTMFIVFIISGLWHGPNWTFVFFGILHGIAFIPYILFRGKLSKEFKRKNFGEGRVLPSLKESFLVLSTFSFFLFTAIFFRSPTIADAFLFIKGIFNWYEHPTFLNPYDHQSLTKELIFLGLFILTDYLLNAKKLDRFKELNIVLWTVSAILVILIIINNPLSKEMSFIYFQF